MRCLCEKYTTDPFIEVHYIFYDFNDKEILCPICKKTLYVEIPNHIPKKQRVLYADTVLMKLYKE